MYKVFTVVILIASSMLACRPDPGEQYNISPELVSEMDWVSPTVLRLPESYGQFFTDFYKNKSIFITVNPIIETSPPAVSRLRDKIHLQENYKGQWNSQDIESYKNKFRSIKNTFANVQFIEGKVRPGLNQESPDYSQQADANTFVVSLIKYFDLHFGVIELPDDKVLLLYGDKLQIVNFKVNEQVSENRKILKYQALMTESFNVAYDGNGLLYILGSYMTQRYLFHKNFNILLELDDLIYRGGDLLVVDPDDRESVVTDLQEKSAITPRYRDKAFSIFYSDQLELAEVLVGSPQGLGVAPINQVCVMEYKALWSSPYVLLDEGNPGQKKYGQYILDAHEISHMLGAKHNGQEHLLMSRSTNIKYTRLDYILENNIAAVDKSKSRVNKKGNCEALSVLPVKLRSVGVPLEKDKNPPELCGPEHHSAH